MERYLIPARRTRAETSVQKSRFIANLAPVFNVDEAHLFIQSIRTEFPDAAHHVPAYIIGHGASTITHCSDDREPSGTAGRPALAMLSGSGLGDAALVITRYFGGVKLGTGGLVRAYSEAARLVLAAAPRAEKMLVHTMMIAIPYPWFERLSLLVAAHGGEIIDREFAADITLSVSFPDDRLAGFQFALQDASHGSLHGEVVETRLAVVPIAAPPS